MRNYNTFGIDISAREFVAVSDPDELRYLIDRGFFRKRNHLMIGGGSNILFTKDFDGLVVKNDIEGIDAQVYGDEVIVTAGGGVVWNDLVWYCIDRNYGGIENLSLIPGSAGAGPIQNIGAYGVELKDCFHKLDALETATGEMRSFNGEECRFGYRDSIFKRELKGRVVIVTVSLKLRIGASPDISYGAIREKLAAMKIAGAADMRSVGLAVNAIRREKLPDPEVAGNAGSFFKNPVIAADTFEVIFKQYPDMPSYQTGHDMRKVPAGWLIEQCGWKGKRFGRAGVHNRQALVLVNHGGATGPEILALAEEIQQSVMKKFGIWLETEVNMI